MADSVALSVQLAGAEAALAQLTQLDSVVKSLKANRNVNISVNSRSLSTAADRAEQLNTNLKQAQTTAQQMGTAGARNINQAGQALDKASRNAESFRLGMGSVVLNMAKFRLASSAINLVANGFKEAFNEIKSVDTELVNIRKVTGFTNDEIEKLSKNAYALASQYGRSASEVLEASTVFARAGYTDQIDQLSELSLLLQNVGDLQAEDASKFVIATDKAYKLGGSYESLMAVIDGLDNITNKNATDMQKMTEGMTVAGSVFAESGESIQTFAALLGTATANTQRSGSEVARGLRTILMNLRQIRGETEDGELIDGESIAAAAKALKDYANISTMENGQLRKASDVLTELAGKWDTLTETQRAAIAEAVGGKRQANILMSLMGDWESVQKMMMEYEEAAGTAASENALYMDSWQAKIEQVKASWTEVVASMTSSDTIKDALDVVIERLEIIKGIVESDGFEKFFGIFTKAGAGWNNILSDLAPLPEDGSKGRKLLLKRSDYEDLYRDLGQANLIFSNTQDIDTYKEKIAGVVDEYGALYQKLSEARDAGTKLSPLEQDFIETFESIKNSTEASESDIELYGRLVATWAEAMGASWEEAAEVANQAMDEIAEALGYVPSEKTISINVEGYEDAISKLSGIGAAASSSFATVFANATAGLPHLASGTSGAPGGPALVNENGPEMIAANGLAWIAGGGKPTVTMLPKGAQVFTAQQTRQATGGKGFSGIPAYADGTPGNREYHRLTADDLYDSTPSVISGDTDTKYKVKYCPVCGTPNPIHGRRCVACGFNFEAAEKKEQDKPGGGTIQPGGATVQPSGGKTQEEIFKDLEEELNDRLKNLNAQAKLAENEEDFLKAMQIYGEAQDYIAELLEQYRAAGYAEDSDEILRLANLGYDYAAKQLGGYDKLQQNLIDALNELTKATEDANELAERQAAVDKAREALANAEKQRTVRIFNPVTGQWEWVANAGDVARAQENLKNAEESLRKEELSQAISAIQNADAESLGNMTLSPAILDALFGATPDQQSAFLNALGAATGGANWLSSSAAQTAWNQGNSIGTQYNLNGINLTPEQASGMTIMQLITMLQGLKIM